MKKLKYKLNKQGFVRQCYTHSSKPKHGLESEAAGIYRFVDDIGDQAVLRNDGKVSIYEVGNRALRGRFVLMGQSYCSAEYVARLLKTPGKVFESVDVNYHHEGLIKAHREVIRQVRDRRRRRPKSLYEEIPQVSRYTVREALRLQLIVYRCFDGLTVSGDPTKLVFPMVETHHLEVINNMYPTPQVLPTRGGRFLGRAYQAHVPGACVVDMGASDCCMLKTGVVVGRGVITQRKKHGELVYSNKKAKLYPLLGTFTYQGKLYGIVLWYSSSKLSNVIQCWRTTVGGDSGTACVELTELDSPQEIPLMESREAQIPAHTVRVRTMVPAVAKYRIRRVAGTAILRKAAGAAPGYRINRAGEIRSVHGNDQTS